MIQNLYYLAPIIHLSPIEEMRPVLGVDTHANDPIHKGNSLKGRVLCVINLSLHIIGIVVKPIVYAIAAIVQLCLILPYKLMFAQHRHQKISAAIQAFQFAGCALVSPFVHIAMAARAIAGIAHPSAYYKPSYLLPLSNCIDYFYAQQEMVKGALVKLNQEEKNHLVDSLLAKLGQNEGLSVKLNRKKEKVQLINAFFADLDQEAELSKLNQKEKVHFIFDLIAKYKQLDEFENKFDHEKLVDFSFAQQSKKSEQAINTFFDDLDRKRKRNRLSLEDKNQLINVYFAALDQKAVKGICGNAKYFPEIEVCLHIIAEEFQAQNPDGTPKLSDEDKVHVLRTLAEASRHCKPRWYQDTYFEACRLREPPVEKRFEFYVKSVIEKLLFGFASRQQHIHDVNYVNGLKVLFGEKLGINVDMAHEDPYAHPNARKEFKILSDFLKAECTDANYIDQVADLVNSLHNLDLRIHIFNEVFPNFPEIVKEFPKIPIGEEIPVLEILKRYSIGGDSVKNYDMFLNEDAIRLLLKPQLNRFQMLRKQSEEELEKEEILKIAGELGYDD